MNRRSFLKALIAGSVAAAIGATPKRLGDADPWPVLRWSDGALVRSDNHVIDSMRYVVAAIRDDPGLWFSGETS